MEYAILAGLIVGGLILLSYGGDWVVDGGVGLAKNLGVTPLVIGIVFLGFATSVPELFTSLNGALRGSPGVALGNVVGSNIANLLLIAGVTAALAATKVRRSMIYRDGGFVLASSGLLVFFLFYFGYVDRTLGAVLLALLAVYLITSIVYGRYKAIKAAEAGNAVEVPESDLGTGAAFLWFAIGISATFAGAFMLVEGAVGIARSQGVSEALIGLTIVAFGTSLPELAAAIAAGRRNQPELIVGNVLGSNVFNVGAVVGVTAMIQPMSRPMDLSVFDVSVMMLGTMLMLFLAHRGRQLSRFEGFTLLLCYVLYIAAIALYPELRSGVEPTVLKAPDSL